MELLRVRPSSYRRSIDKRVRYLVEDFVGRDDVIGALEAIEPGDQVVIEGDAGDGKSRARCPASSPLRAAVVDPGS